LLPLILNLTNAPFGEIGLILLVFAVSTFLIIIFYKRTGEIEQELGIIKREQEDLDERLKIYDKFVQLEARIIALENRKNGKKR